VTDLEALAEASRLAFREASKEALLVALESALLDPLASKLFDPLALKLLEPLAAQLLEALLSTLRLEFLLKEELPLAVGNSHRIHAISPVGDVIHGQARAALISRRQWRWRCPAGVGVGDCHGVFLLVKITTSNVDTHIAAAAVT
jgi:hypothetical protein